MIDGSNDVVRSPNHYTQGDIECIDAMKSALGADGFLDYCAGNVLKYVWRWKFKNGHEDLEKAKQYLDFMLNFLKEGTTHGS